MAIIPHRTPSTLAGEQENEAGRRITQALWPGSEGSSDMRLDKFTIKAQEALQQAQSLADQLGQQEILPEHLLATLLDQEEGIIRPLLQKLGADPRALRSDVQKELDRLPKVQGVSGQLYLSARLRKDLDRAWEET